MIMHASRKPRWTAVRIFKRPDTATDMFTGAITVILGNRDVMPALLPKRRTAAAVMNETAAQATISIEAPPGAV
jgi:hypothetical protein